MYEAGKTTYSYDQPVGIVQDGKLIGHYERRTEVSLTSLAKKLAPPIGDKVYLYPQWQKFYYCSNCNGVFKEFRELIVPVERIELLYDKE